MVVATRHSPIYKLVSCAFWFNVFLSIVTASFLPISIRFMTSTTYSMSPTISPNDLTIVREQYRNSYDVGDIISFYRSSAGKETIVTHRIKALGGNVYITKGDNNAAIDKEVVRPRLIIGKVIMVIPKIGSYVKFLKSDVGTFLLIIIPAIWIMAMELRVIQRMSSD